MARQSLKSQLESLLGKKRRGVTVKWRPTHRGIIDTSHREIRRGLGRGLKDDVHGYVFWDVATEDFDSDFAHAGEFIQLSNRDYRIGGMIYEPESLDKTTDGREEWFVMGTSPRAIRAMADEVGGTAFSIEAIEDNTKPQKKSPAETKARDKAEADFKKKLEKIGYTVRLSHLRGRSISVKGTSEFYRGIPSLAGIWLAAWETNLFRFYSIHDAIVKTVAPDLYDPPPDIKASFKEATVIPAKRWRLEKAGLAEALEKESKLTKRRGMEYPDIKPREDHHYR